MTSPVSHVRLVRSHDTSLRRFTELDAGASFRDWCGISMNLSRDRLGPQRDDSCTLRTYMQPAGHFFRRERHVVKTQLQHFHACVFAVLRCAQ
jgi:hypothetical protein